MSCGVREKFNSSNVHECGDLLTRLAGRLCARATTDIDLNWVVLTEGLKCISHKFLFGTVEKYVV